MNNVKSCKYRKFTPRLQFDLASWDYYIAVVMETANAVSVVKLWWNEENKLFLVVSYLAARSATGKNAVFWQYTKFRHTTALFSCAADKATLSIYNLQLKN